MHCQDPLATIRPLMHYPDPPAIYHIHVTRCLFLKQDYLVFVKFFVDHQVKNVAELLRVEASKGRDISEQACMAVHILFFSSFLQTDQGFLLLQSVTFPEK